MSTHSKRIKLQPNVLLEYIFDDTNFKSEDYKVLTNLKEKSKSYISTSNNNNIENSIFSIDTVMNKYSNVDVENFNYLRIQNYSSAPVIYDKVKIYFPSGFDFYDDYLGFYINMYAHGYNNNSKYSLTNFHYIKSNINVIDVFDLPVPFFYDEKFWVRYIEIEFPSPNTLSSQRIISNAINEATSNTINKNLTYGEGIAPNSPIFIDFSFITSTTSVLGIDYYFTGDEYSVSLPQTPEFTELGVNVSESTQGDYFEIYATYLGTNENMDEFVYNEEIKGNTVKLEYVVTMFEENILVSTQTYQVSSNYTQKILYRPVIQFSNTTAMIDVELKIVNLVDSSYISKFGSLGIYKNINKYGLRLTQLNLSNNVLKPEIFNLKVKNTMTSTTGSIESTIDIMKVPYPIMIDKYNILAKSTNSSSNSNSNYVANGLLEILITPFDNVINLNIAKDIDATGDPMPYDLSEVSTNAKVMIVFKSNSEKLQKEPFYEADNTYELGDITYKLEETDQTILRRIYDKGYDNFYIVINSNGTNTQLYSGKYAFYEDVTFINETTTTTTTTTSGDTATTTSGNTATTTTADTIISSTEEVSISTETIDEPDVTIDSVIEQNNPFIKETMPIFEQDPLVDKNYYNVLVYVRFQTNIDKMKAYVETNDLTAKITYGNVFFFERIYVTILEDIKKQEYIEKVFEIELGVGQAPKELIKEVSTKTNITVYKDVEVDTRLPVDDSVPNTHRPPKPSFRVDDSRRFKNLKRDIDLDIDKLQ